MAILPLAPLTVELILRTVDAWIAVPFVTTASGLAFMLYASRRIHRGRFVAGAMIGVVAVFVYLGVHTAPAGYARMSARTLARAAAAGTTQDYRFCSWGNSRLSFLFYASLEDAQAFRRSNPGDLDALAEWMRSNRPVCCVVSGESHLALLRRACPEGFRILGVEEDCWLVVNEHSTGPSVAAVDSPSSAEDEE